MSVFLHTIYLDLDEEVKKTGLNVIAGALDRLALATSRHTNERKGNHSQEDKLHGSLLCLDQCESVSTYISVMLWTLDIFEIYTK